MTRERGGAPNVVVGGGAPTSIEASSARAPAAALATDTIAALATPPGRGAIAVLRLSGPHADAVAARVLAPWPLPPRVARLCTLRDPHSGETIDRPLVTRFEEGRSYTGEASLEIATHGGWAVPAAALAALVAAGAREALPGEFTRRAVLNGKLDVVQAEAIADLVDARSHAMHRAALAQLDGGLSRRVARLREQLLEVEALLAYDIDFPEEDDGPVPRERVAGAARGVLASLDALLATAPAGELVREGAVVVIAGPPNAGKSSLFNALLGHARAIVTEVPGTTRDALEAVLDAGDWPLRLVDTAGLRETADVVERLGIEVSERYLAGAHVVLACGERDADVADTAARVGALTAAPVIGVRTKGDLRGGEGTDRDATMVGGSSPTDNVPAGREPRVERGSSSGTQPSAPLVVSAETGAGLRELLAAVVGELAARYGAPTAEVPLVTRARHRRALTEARDELALFAHAWDEALLPPTVAAVHVRTAVGALETLVGAMDVEDVLDRVFSTFCVGK